MTRLIGDRYYLCGPGEACDLATGAVVPVAQLSAVRVARERPLDALLEVLDHGREGMPRWVAGDATSPARIRAVLDRAAADGQARGYVPVAVELYRQLGRVLRDELADRTVLLLAGPGVPPARAGAALVEAAAASPRPHVLFTLRQIGGSGPTCVREARAAYGAEVPGSAPATDVLPADVRQHLERASRADVFIAAGRHAAAVRLLRDVAAALSRRRAPAAAARVQIRLAQTLLDRGRAADADAAATEAAAAGAAAGDAVLESEARIWQAIARADRGQLTAAESLCRALLVAGRLSERQRAWTSAVLARVLLCQRRPDDAAAIDLSVPVAESDVGVSTYVRAMGARVRLACGELFEAGQLARAALAAAQGTGAAWLIASLAHLRLLAAAGDLALTAEHLAEIVHQSRQARLPLTVVRARLIWADALARAGRRDALAREHRYFRRVRAVVSPLLRQAIDARIGARAVPLPVVPVRAPTMGPDAATALVVLVQNEDQDEAAVRRAIEWLRARLGAGRVDVWSAAAGPATVILTGGAGLATRIGTRILDAGIPVRARVDGGGTESGVPIRLGTRLLGALVARWPVDAASNASGDGLLTLAAAVTAARVEALLHRASAAGHAAAAIPELVGASAAMDDVRKAVTRAAGAPFAVLIEGESGVGKELVARAIHQLGARRDRRFCDINCAALPDELLESELFGHARGAFTGAITDRRGLFEDADGGTLLLDEVADLSSRAQAKLLRVLQQHEVRRVGETFTRRVDVRIVSAANRDLHAEAAAGRFRQDLLYRLDVIRLRIPPLRERVEDVALLAEHFWRSAAARIGTTATLSHGILAALARYHWPGNVRELQNVIATLAVNAPSRGRVGASLLPPVIGDAAPTMGGPLVEARERFERRYVEVALARAGGSRTRAARELGLSRQGLLKTMKRLGLDCRVEEARSRAAG